MTKNLLNHYKDKEILKSQGTVSFNLILVNYLLKYVSPKLIIINSTDEKKHSISKKELKKRILN